MTETNYLRVVLLDADSAEFVIPIYNYKENLTLSEVRTVFQVLFDTNKWCSPSGALFVSVKKVDVIHLEITEEDIT